jgi:hypothetical protein
VSAGLELLESRLRNGRWEGLLRSDGPAPPELEIRHLDSRLDGVELQPDRADGRLWHVRVPIPPAAISDGVQTFVLRDGAGAVVGSFAFAAGRPLEADLRAEIDLLRAELDLVKAALRRHLREEHGPPD